MNKNWKFPHAYYSNLYSCKNFCDYENSVSLNETDKKKINNLDIKKAAGIDQTNDTLTHQTRNSRAYVIYSVQLQPVH